MVFGKVTKRLLQTLAISKETVHYFSMPDHGGTHIDASRHFSIDGTPINEYPFENCIVKCIVSITTHRTKIRDNVLRFEEAVKKTANRFQKMVLYCFVQAITRGLSHQLLIQQITLSEY